MNKFRNTAIALVILVLLNIYILTVVKKEEKLPEPDLVFDDIEAPIDKIKISFPEGDSLVFERREETDWEMIFPYHFIAAPYKIDEMMAALENLNYIQKVPIKEEEKKNFGFENGPFKISFDTENKKRIINLGDKTFDDRNYYAETSDTDEIFIINEMFISHFERDALGYKDLQIARYDREELESITFKGKDQLFKVIRKEDTFEITYQKDGKDIDYVDEEAQELVQELTFFAAGRWINLNAYDLSAYGIDQPEYTLTIKAKEDTINIRIGEFDGVYYGQVGDNPEVFEVTRYIFTLLKRLTPEEDEGGETIEQD